MYYLGVDLGGTNIAVGLVNEKGELLHKESIPTIRERNYEEILKDLANLCIKIIKDNNLEVKDIESIGVGSPGTCDSKEGVIVYSNNIAFENTPLRKEIQKYIDLPVFLENDANCAALGESVRGAAYGYKDSITITLGTGIGGGVLINGKILSGAFFGGGELGHHVIVSGGEQCTCGRKGCWEAYASATALIRDTKIAALRYPLSKISEEVNGDFNLISAKTVFDVAEKGDKVATEVIDKYLSYIAEGVANMLNIFQPEIIVIGGGVCAQGEKILLPIEAHVKKLSYGGELKTKMAIAKLGNDAGIIGAAMLGLN